MARDGAAETKTGWVYRSDTGSADAGPVPENLSPAVISRPAPTPESRSAEPHQPIERGWIESGFYVMTLPLTLTVRLMLAPVNWMFGARPRP